MAAPGLQEITDADFRRLVTTVEDYAIFLLDPTGHILTWNRGAERIKGWTADEIIGMHFSIFYPEEDKAKPEMELRGATATGRWEDEAWRVRKDGSRFWANVVITALRDETGTLRGFAKVTRDLTERKRGEERLVQEQAARARAEERERMLGEAVRMRDDFLSVATHELRTPLATLRLLVEGMLRLAERGELAADRAQTKLRSVLGQVDRFERLVSDLLDVSRIQQGRLTLDPHPLDLVQLAVEVVDRFRDELQRQRCALRLAHPGSLIGNWDHGRLDQVLTNLLSNAMKYGRGAPIELTLRGEGDRAHVVVRDHGIGIAPEEQPFIFDRFHRAASVKHYGGMGLGLWITREILRAMGGTIHVESRPGEGATFEVAVPWER